MFSKMMRKAGNNKLTVAACCAALTMYYSMGDPLLFLLNVIILLIILGLAVRELRASAILIVSGLFVLMPINGYFRLTDMVRVRAFWWAYNECALDATPIGTGGALGMCRREPWDNLYEVETIVYDSSGQVAWSPEERTTNWKRAAYSLPPFGILPFTAKPLGGQYFSVTFDETRAENCTIGSSAC